MRVWNITHLTGDPKYVTISGKRCSPGRSVEIDSITQKERALEGSYIFIGNFIPEKNKNLGEPLTREDCTKYLKSKSKEDLLSLARHISPALTKDLDSKSVLWLQSKITNAIFSDSFELSPSKFFWTNHWVRSGLGYRKL